MKIYKEKKYIYFYVDGKIYQFDETEMTLLGYDFRQVFIVKKGLTKVLNSVFVAIQKTLPLQYETREDGWNTVFVVFNGNGKKFFDCEYKLELIEDLGMSA